MNKIIVVKCECTFTEIPIEVDDNLMERIIALREISNENLNKRLPNPEEQRKEGREIRQQLAQLAGISESEHNDTIYDDDWIDNPKLKQRFKKVWDESEKLLR